mgnify:CR=1 FL=1
MISDGKDGKDYEYIYTRGNIIDNPPEKPDSQQKDDYIPEGWTDDFVGVDADHQVEWGCTRLRKTAYGLSSALRQWCIAGVRTERMPSWRTSITRWSMQPYFGREGRVPTDLEYNCQHVVRNGKAHP